MKFLLILLFAVNCSSLYSKPIQKLFLHIDKSIYVENENICFAAYLNGGEDALISKHRILSVVLFRDEDRTMIRSGQFVMQGGVASGLLTVPDTITGGNYHLYAYTDIVDKSGKPLVDFIGKIVIKNTRPPKISSALAGKPIEIEKDLNSYKSDTLTSIIVSIEADQEIYKPRETVKLKISLKDQNDEPIQGLFSIATVQTNRIKPGYRKINIVEDNSTHEAIAVITDTINTKETADYGRLPLIFRGQVTRNRKPVKKAVELVLLNAAGISAFSTDARGQFTVDPELLYSESGNSIRVLPKGNGSTFDLNFINPFDSLNKLLTASVKIPLVFDADPATTEDFQLKEFEKYDELDKVTVVARNNNSLYGYKGKVGPNPCGDYVDEFDYLNYEFSKNKYQPVVGKQYLKRTDLNDMRTLFKVDPVHYTGCRTEAKQNGISVEPIHHNQSLAVVDELISEPQFLSTLLWKPFVLTENNGSIGISFVAGDIVGSFTIMIQGITDAAPFSGSALITIKK